MGIKFLLLVAVGGSCGSVLRALVGILMKSYLPWPTLVVNLLGAFLIGLLVKFSESSANAESFRAFWIIGLCGGFTTFSTFGMDMVNFIKTGHWTNGLIYLSLNFFGTLLAIFIGFRTFSLISS
jgi:fluoride exporter